jgi:hypothetical protein
MTSVDWFNLAVEADGNALAAFGILLTLLSGYLVLGYLVGVKLTRAQVYIVNTLYMLSYLSVAAGHWQYMHDSMAARQQASILLPTVFFPLPSHHVILISTAIAVIHSGLLLGSLYFMWSSRGSRFNDRS